MLRYIMKHKWVDAIIGASGERLYSVDGDACEVERLLKAGGHGESGCEQHELVGIEVIEN